MRNTLNNLRARTTEEKRAIAAGVAIAVVALLFIGWIILFFQSIKNTPAPNLQNTEDQLNANGLQQADQQFEQAVGSTTQFIQTAQGTMQLEEIGTTTQTEDQTQDQTEVQSQ